MPRMSYGANLTDTFGPHREGAKPGDLPIGEPTKFDLLVKLKTASALALAIPPAAWRTG
jgi:putative tryptophan/tyrosine transport system substrate-binding protein